MKRKKKMKNRRFTAIMLVLALCLTMSGFKSFAAYGGTNPDTESADTVLSDDEIADTASVVGEISNDGEDQNVTDPDSAGDEDTDDGDVEAYSDDDADETGADDADAGEDGVVDDDSAAEPDSGAGADDADAGEDGVTDDDNAADTGDGDADDAGDEEEWKTEYWLDYGPYEGDMLADDTRTIPFSLRYSAQDEDGNEYEDYTEDFDLNVSVSDDPDDYDDPDYRNPEAVKVEATGKEIKVTALGEGGVMLKVTAQVDGKDVAAEKLWFNVTNCYRVLSCDIDNVELGEIIDLNDIEWTITEYSDEHRDGRRVETEEEGYTLSFDYYDSDVWEVVEKSDDGPSALKRIRPYGTSLQVIALQTDEEDGGWRCDQWLSFDDLGYWVHLEQNGDDVQSSLFSGDSMTINAVCERDFIPENIDILWDVFEYDEDGEEVKTEAVDWERDGENLTLTANENHDGTWIHVRATLYYDGTELDCDERDVEILDPINDYYLPDPGVMLWTDERWIGNEIEYYLRNQDYPEEAYGTVPITDIDITGQYTWDEDGNPTEAEDAVAYLDGDADEGWNLVAQSCGYVTLVITYQTVDGESVTEKTEVYIAGDRYNVDWDYPEGISQILVGEEMRIGLGMSHEWLESDEDGNAQYECEEIESFDVDLDYDKDLINVEFDKEKNELVITGKEYGGTWISVTCTTKDAGESSMDIWVDVSQNYTNLKPVSLDNVEIGGTLDLSEIDWVVEYKETAEDGSTSIDEYTMENYPEDLRFYLGAYAEEGWDIIGDEDAGLPVLKRLSQDDTWITIVAEMRNEEGEWEEIRRQDYWFDYLDYSIGWIEDQVDCVFNDSELTLTLNDENLADKKNAEIEWTVGYWNENEDFIELENNSLFTGEGKSITLNGAALFEKLSELEMGGVTVHAQVVVDGEPVDGADNWIYVEVLEPEFYWEDGEDSWLLPGQYCRYDNWQGTASIRNADHPYGEDVLLTISDVTIVDDGVVEKSTDDEGGLRITALPEGVGQSTDVKFTAGDDAGNEYEFTVTMYVENEYKYYTGYIERENGNIDSGEYILPGASIQLYLDLVRSFYDAETGEISYSVAVDDVKNITYSYDNEDYPGLLEVTEDGLVTVKNLEELEELGYLEQLEDSEEGIWTYVIATAAYTGEDGLDEFSAEVWLCVSTEYETEETEILYLEPGDTVSPEDVNAYRKHYTQDSNGTTHVENSEISVESFYDPEDSALEVSEDGKKLTVSKDLVITDEPYRTVVIMKIGENEALDLLIQVDNHTHIWDEGTVTKEPTCTEEGIMTYTCTKATCGETKTVSIPSKGHALEHYVRVEPTATSNGNIEYWYCDVCGKYFRDAEAKYEIPAAAIVLPAVKPAAPVGTGGTSGTGSANGTANAGNTTNTSGTGTAASPGTGDQNMTLLWFVVMAGALGVLFTVGVKRRRSR